MDSAAVIRRLEADGWELVRIKGSHHHYRHPTKPGIVAVVHPLKDVPKGTLGSIQRQARIKLRD
jgi:predicted RNA binding protein YcfA (HicA-like mRNA interferase family)